MNLNVRRRELVETIVVSTKCKKCNKELDIDDVFCRYCGNRLIPQDIKVYANIGKRGVTSYSYVFPGGATFNSKGKITLNVGKGISLTTEVD